MRSGLRQGVVALSLGTLLLAAGVTAQATSSDPCQKLYTSNTVANLQKYEDCRFDRIDAAQKRIEDRLGAPTPAPSPSATPASPTPTTPASPTPTPDPTTPTPTPTQPSGFTLAKEPNQPAGDYYAKFPKAAAAGWGKNRFPIAVFFGKPSHAPQLKAVGVNTYMGAEHDGSPMSTITGQGISVLAQTEWTRAEVGDDSKVVGWHVSDECDMGYSGCTPDWNNDNGEQGRLAVQQGYVSDIRAFNDGRFLQANFGNGVARTWWAPTTMDDHIKLMDSSSVDKYLYTSPGSRDVVSASGDWPSGVDPKRAAGYGWLQDQMERFQDPANPKPNWVFVEVAKPFLTESGATTITPDQIEGAVWSAIIHGARGIAYFQHNNNGCGGYALVDAGCPQATKDRVKAVDAAVQSLAPVINSDSYVYDYQSPGIDTMTKQADGSLYVFAGVGLKGTAGSKTFTLPTGVTGASVEVVGENRTIPVSGGKFTDAFAAEYSHHVYKITI